MYKTINKIKKVINLHARKEKVKKKKKKGWNMNLAILMQE